MLIDSSYFSGHINIPNKDFGEVSSLIDTLIKEHETNLLRGFMGYELFTAFIAGLAIAPTPQKWLDVLFGKAFTPRFSSKQVKWDGLISATGEPVIINGTTITPLSSYVPSRDKSPIAYYVYYWYLRNDYNYAPAVTGLDGTATAAMKNPAALSAKDAYNKCTKQMRVFMEFLISDPASYPEFIGQDQNCEIRDYVTDINLYNIL